MITEDKQLLLKDLCARLPYGVICNTPKGNGHLCSINQTIFGTEYGINISSVKRDYFNDRDIDIKPYLRSMSSMIEEEWQEYDDFCDSCRGEEFIELIDWLNAHHFDYRGLIPKGLALEAPKGMYKTE